MAHHGATELADEKNYLPLLQLFRLEADWLLQTSVPGTGLGAPHTPLYQLYQSIAFGRDTGMRGIFFRGKVG